VFTGIVEELGAVTALEHRADDARLTVRCPRVATGAEPGSSVAVNGVCLTVVEVGDGVLTADVMAETLSRSSLGALGVGSPVNLERPMALGGRLGGHLVQGHVDGTGVVVERVPGRRWEMVRISLPTALARYVVEKGSITVDGVSLTVVGVTPADFTVGLVPTTLAQTTLGTKGPGEPVNLEVDVLAKYVEKLLAHAAAGRP
jgi:riboflavin synthase